MPGAIVVNVGDILARWSNDTFKSTVHRAVNDEHQDRLAIAFFRCCNYDTMVENLVEGSASKYPPVLAGEHMLARIEDANTVP